MGKKIVLKHNERLRVREQREGEREGKKESERERVRVCDKNFRDMQL